MDTLLTLATHLPLWNALMTQNDIRLFFDISALLNHIQNSGHYTGIQRVVSMLISEISTIHNQSNTFITYLDRLNNTHKCISMEALTSEVLKSPTLLKAAFSREKAPKTSDKILERYLGNPLKLWYYKILFDFLAKRGKNRKFKRFGITSSDWIEIRKTEGASLEKNKLEPQRVSELMRSDDRLILLDSTWNGRYFSSFEKARKRGCHVYTLVHDLIPIISPETTPGYLPLDFERWLSSSVDFTDSYLTVSDATRKDLEVFIDTIGEKKDVQVLRLAQDRFDDSVLPIDETSSPQNALVEWGHDRLGKVPDLSKIIHLSDQTREALGTPYVLCVGTIEPRKNVWRLALAWKYLIDQGHTDLPRLVIAGKESVMVQSLKDLLSATGNIYGYVSIIESPSEEALKHLYINCIFLAMPSLFEGWGLPVGEALSFGKTGVVSNASSLPEVGGNMVEYCDPQSVKSIADAVSRLVYDPAHRESLEARIRETELRSWHMVAKDLYEIAVLQKRPEVGSKGFVAQIP